MVVITCPEACGVNVTSTVLTIGVKLEWPPIGIVRQVAIAGEPLSGLFQSSPEFTNELKKSHMVGRNVKI